MIRQKPSKATEAGSYPGLFLGICMRNSAALRILRWLRLDSTGKTLRRSTFGFARIFKDSAVEGIEPMGGCKETETGLITNNNACGFRANFDDVGIRHAFLLSCPPLGSSRALTPKN